MALNLPTDILFLILGYESILLWVFLENNSFVSRLSHLCHQSLLHCVHNNEFKKNTWKYLRKLLLYHKLPNPETTLSFWESLRAFTLDFQCELAHSNLPKCLQDIPFKARYAWVCLNLALLHSPYLFHSMLSCLDWLLIESNQKPKPTVYEHEIDLIQLYKFLIKHVKIARIQWDYGPSQNAASFFPLYRICQHTSRSKYAPTGFLCVPEFTQLLYNSKQE
jgi:hypothetical protein